MATRSSDDQVAAISQFKGQPVAVGCLFGDDDGKAYRYDFAEIFTGAEWDLGGRVGEMSIDPDPIGVSVAMDKKWILAGNAPPKAAEALIAALNAQKVMDGFTLTLTENLPPGPIVLIVGKKPR
jgi:hypothetical protein